MRLKLRDGDEAEQEKKRRISVNVFGSRKCSRVVSKREEDEKKRRDERRKTYCCRLQNLIRRGIESCPKR